MFPAEDFLGEAVSAFVRVAAEAGEMGGNAEPGGAAKVIGDMQRFAAEFFGAGAGGGDGVEFGADVHEAAEPNLLALQFRAVADHGVEKSPGEFAGAALRPAGVSWQAPSTGEESLRV